MWWEIHVAHQKQLWFIHLTPGIPLSETFRVQSCCDFLKCFFNVFFFNGTSILSWRCLHCLKHRVAWEFTCLNAWREWDDGWPVENNNCGKKSICLEFQLFQRIVCRADGNESSQKHAFHATNGITAFNWTSRWRIKNKVSFDKKKKSARPRK